MRKSKILVFSGFNQRAVIAFVRTLEKNGITDYSIIASGKKDTILKTEYYKHIIYTRKNRNITLEEMIWCVKIAKNGSNRMIWIAPTTEYLNRFILRHKEIFNDMGCIFPCVDEKLYEQISDKLSFSEICKKENIFVPKEYNFIEKYSASIVAKPRKYISENGEIYSPVLIYNKNDFSRFCDEYDQSQFYYQDLLEGKSFYLLFYFSRGGEVAIFSQENIAQQFAGKSIIAARASRLHEDEQIVSPYIRLFQKMKFKGLVMIELRLSNGKYYMIEANPRFWGPSELFCDAGYNFFEIMLMDYGFIENKNFSDINYESVYFWSGGMGDVGANEEPCVWFGNGKAYFEKNKRKFEEVDIYRRKDTMNIYKIEELSLLYKKTSKHSNYQILASELADKIDQNKLKTKSRWEKERFLYIREKINLEGKKILDIGGNTGFFTFESICEGAKCVEYFEGNKTHADFVKLAAEILNYEKKISVNPSYYMFEIDEKKYDIIYNLNVVHHLGEDFLNENRKEKAKEEMMEQINRIAFNAHYMFFQMGFNWKGDKKENLFEYGTKREMIEFVKEQTTGFWEIIDIGIAKKENGFVRYVPLDEKNIERDDSLGEFLNRPIFVMKSEKQ